MKEIFGLIRAYCHAKKAACGVTDPEINVGQAVGSICINSKRWQIQIHLVQNKKQWRGEESPFKK